MQQPEPIKVLIVEDSPVAARLLSMIIHTDPTMLVIGTATTGEQALELVKVFKPDVITMDIVLPKMDGFETTRQIMHTHPTPIVIVSATFKKKDVEKSFKAINAGAIDILEKPIGPRDPNFHLLAETLLKSIKHAAKATFPSKEVLTKIKKESINLKHIHAIAIGASLGGPKALNFLFSQLPETFPIPIFVVQHISSGFTSGLVDWLQSSCPLRVKLAENFEKTKSSCIYVAPENFHLEVNANHTIHLTRNPPVNGLRPSVGHLFGSMATAYKGHGCGIILTGMGHDGADELLSMKESGAMTIAQDQESSLVFGMPKEAIAKGAVKHVLSLQEIAEVLRTLT